MENMLNMFNGLHMGPLEDFSVAICMFVRVCGQLKVCEFVY